MTSWSVSPDGDVTRSSLAFDQSSGFDPTHVEPVPDFNFDQSPPDAWDD